MLIISSKLEHNFRMGRWKNVSYGLESLHVCIQKHSESPLPSLQCSWKYQTSVIIIPPFMVHYHSFLWYQLPNLIYLFNIFIIFLFFFSFPSSTICNLEIMTKILPMQYIIAHFLNTSTRKLITKYFINFCHCSRK